MLAEQLTLEFAFGTKDGSRGIVQGSPAEGNRAKLIEVGLALSNHPKITQRIRALLRAKSIQEEGKRLYWFVIMTSVSPLLQKGPWAVSRSIQRAVLTV